MRPVGIDHVHVLIALAGRRCARDWARHGVGAEIGLVLNRAALRADQVMRTERGFAVRIIVFSTKTAMATSPFWAGRLRGRRLGPIRCLCLNMAVSA